MCHRLQEFSDCVAMHKDKMDCKDYMEDYVECLHHKKEVRPTPTTSSKAIRGLNLNYPLLYAYTDDAAQQAGGGARCEGEGARGCADAPHGPGAPILRGYETRALPYRLRLPT